MRIVYTHHAEDKLERVDIKKFKITKATLRKVLKDPEYQTKTRYGELVALSELDNEHNLRVIYDQIEATQKIITFHVARKGRYV